MNNNIIYGLVFGGGGAKGAYELGVWKALAKMNIQVGSVVGASIGAINGALFTQGDLRSAQFAWRNLNLSDAIVLENVLPNPDNLFDIRNINAVVHSMFHTKGLDMEPVRVLLKKYIDEDRVRLSPVDFGVISYDLTNRRPVEIFINDMPEGTLYDYLMASACFPVFKSVEIEGQKFIDGGVYNNLPAGMLINKGYSHLIVVDIGGMGITRNFGSDNIDIIHIKPSTPLGGLFDMSKNVTKRSIQRGCLDTYRAFGRLADASFYLTVRSTARFIRKHGKTTLDGLESAALFYGIDPYRIYTADRLRSVVLAKFLEDSQKYVHLRKSASADELRARLLSARPRLRKAEKNYLVPAAVDILQDPNITERSRAIARRLMPSAMGIAEALVALGVKQADTLPV